MVRLGISWQFPPASVPMPISITQYIVLDIASNHWHMVLSVKSRNCVICRVVGRRRGDGVMKLLGSSPTTYKGLIKLTKSANWNERRLDMTASYVAYIYARMGAVGRSMLTLVKVSAKTTRQLVVG